jgi:hypothetical protein
MCDYTSISLLSLLVIKSDVHFTFFGVNLHTPSAFVSIIDKRKRGEQIMSSVFSYQKGVRMIFLEPA